MAAPERLRNAPWNEPARSWRAFPLLLCDADSGDIGMGEKSRQHDKAVGRQLRKMGWIQKGGRGRPFEREIALDLYLVAQPLAPPLKKVTAD